MTRTAPIVVSFAEFGCEVGGQSSPVVVALVEQLEARHFGRDCHEGVDQLGFGFDLIEDIVVVKEKECLAWLSQINANKQAY